MPRRQRSGDGDHLISGVLHGLFQRRVVGRSGDRGGFCLQVHPGGDAGRILAQLRADGMTVRAILLTHAHFDHTGAVSELRQALPGVPVYLHPADAALLGSDIFPPIGATVPYDEGDALTVGSLTVRVLHTPGHTPGGVTLLAGDALFTGDTLFQGSMGRTDFAGGSYEARMAS